MNMFKVIDEQFSKVHHVLFMEIEPGKAIFLTKNDALEFRKHYPNLSRFRTNLVTGLKENISYYDVYMSNSGYGIIIPQDVNGWEWDTYLLVKEIPITVHELLKEDSGSANGGNCTKCGKHNEYQDGPYTCYSCANRV